MLEPSGSPAPAPHHGRHVCLLSPTCFNLLHASGAFEVGKCFFVRHFLLLGGLHQGPSR